MNFGGGLAMAVALSLLPILVSTWGQAPVPLHNNHPPGPTQPSDPQRDLQMRSEYHDWG